jgi:hypothetical protein
MVRVGDLRQAGIGLPRGCVDVGGAFQIERLVGPFAIEILDEVIEAGLLPEAIGARGSHGLFFEGEVHPLMASVLLWVTGFDALDSDAEAEPPDGELGEIEEGVWACKWYSVVGSYCIGEAALAEEALERLWWRGPPGWTPGPRTAAGIARRDQ